MTEPANPRTYRPRGLELALVTVLALALLLPGIWSYSLVDPWETHYGEVARRMRQDHDMVHLDWSNEGFRSKPVLTFWLMAASMKALGVADDGGYSGEMVASERTMLAIRLPFVLFGVLGLVAMWWMLARLISRRVAYLSLLVLGTTPFYCLVARQGITDITLVGAMIGAIAMFGVAAEAGNEPPAPVAAFGRRRRISLDQRHVFALIVGLFLLWQVYCYIDLFHRQPWVARGLRVPAPGWLISGPMLVGIGFLILLEMPWRFVTGVRRTLYWLIYGLPAIGCWVVNRVLGARWELPPAHAEVARITTSRQVYMLWFWTFLGISVLGKGPAALGIVGIVCLFYVLLLGKWDDFWKDHHEIARGLLLLLLIAVPWHVGMYFKEGRHFLQEYFVTHLWKRATKGVDDETGTFTYYVSQLGYGMFVWAALVPAGLAALVARTRTSTREGRARFLIATWAVTSMAFFTAVQTKFHHYILPVVPALAIGVALWLDDVWALRARKVGIAAVAGAAIVLVVTNDMMTEQARWIEMFIFRYDRPWPELAPWSVDASDAFLALGVAGAAALALFTVPRLARVGVIALCVVGLSAGLWSMHVYMPIAGTHWGMREAVQKYYQRRDIHGARLVYWGDRQVADDWARGDGVRDTWTLHTLVPDQVQEGQPAEIHITVKSADDKRTEADLHLAGVIDHIDVDAAEIRVRLPASETKQLATLVAAGKKHKRSNRAPIRVVDGDRVIAWQLYWRGEHFWTSDELYFADGRLPEMVTAWGLSDPSSEKFLKYLNDRTLCPEGRRYWIMTEAGRANNLGSILPTSRAKETLQVEDRTSNKFTLMSFIL